MARYAEGTTVSPERSREEISNILKRYKCEGQGWWESTSAGFAQLAFTRNGQPYTLQLPYPPLSDFKNDDYRYKYQDVPPHIQEARRDQEIRRRYRSLALYLKAILEAVDSGIVTFDMALLPYAMLPDRRTVAEAFIPQVQAMLKEGRMPSLGLALPAPR